MKKLSSIVVLVFLCVLAIGAPVEKKLALEKYEGLKYSSAQIPSSPTTSTPKNIILLIGDGMGVGAYDATSLYVHGEKGKLYMEQLPVKGMLKTRSLNNSVTDSAAAGTAMATGNKVNNGNIGGLQSNKDNTFTSYLSYATIANKMGKGIAIITTDSIVGATPAAFYGHRASRHDFVGLVDDLMTSNFDIVLGGSNTLPWFRSTDNATKIEKIAQTHVITANMDELRAAPADKKVIAHLPGSFLDKETSVAEFTEASIERVGKNPNGFFMMVECCYPDKGGHGNDPAKTILGTIHMDYAVKTAVEYSAKNGDTLVIVTADHETGGISKSFIEENQLSIVYTTGSHSAADVPIFAYGPGAEKFSGEIDNTELAQRIAALWAIELDKPKE